VMNEIVTSAALLRACDLSLVGLDKSVANYLDPDLVERLHVLDGHSRGGDITVRQLLDHTSGLPDYFADPTIQAAARSGCGRRGFTPRDLIEIAISSGPPTFAPGRGRAYTDTGFVLAGLILEDVTGMPLHDVYREFVLDRAGMDSTWLESSPEAPRSGPISHHTLDGADVTTSLDPTIDWAGGGLVTTAGDLASLMSGLTNGTLLSDESWADMSNWQDGPTGHYDQYGLGLGRYRFGEHDAIGHHGRWGAFVFWLPFDVVIAGTVNTAGVDRRPLVQATLDALC
jgi:D-alanyl-D-alanine carboxypeptidase